MGRATQIPHSRHRRLAKPERVPVAPLVVSDRPVPVRQSPLLWHPALVFATGQNLKEGYHPAGPERHLVQNVGKAPDGWRRLILESKSVDVDAQQS